VVVPGRVCCVVRLGEGRCEVVQGRVRLGTAGGVIVGWETVHLHSTTILIPRHYCGPEGLLRLMMRLDRLSKKGFKRAHQEHST
jgi:hypothetical protein